MAADWGLDTGSFGAAADHAPGVGLGHRLRSQHVRRPVLGRTEEPSLALLADPRRCDIGVPRLGQRMMAGE
jgi:hypothetical protein